MKRSENMWYYFKRLKRSKDLTQIQNTFSSSFVKCSSHSKQKIRHYLIVFWPACKSPRAIRTLRPDRHFYNFPSTFTVYNAFLQLGNKKQSKFVRRIRITKTKTLGWIVGPSVSERKLTVFRPQKLGHFWKFNFLICFYKTVYANLIFSVNLSCNSLDKFRKVQNKFYVIVEVAYKMTYRLHKGSGLAWQIESLKLESRQICLKLTCYFTLHF